MRSFPRRVSGALATTLPAIAAAAVLAVAADPAAAGQCKYDNGTNDGPCTVFKNDSDLGIGLRCRDWGREVGRYSRNDIRLNPGDNYTCRGHGGHIAWYWKLNGGIGMGSWDAYALDCPSKKGWYYLKGNLYRERRCE